MKDNDIFPPWGDLDDGKPSVWACDWFIDEGMEVEDVFVTVGYDYREEFILKYHEIREAYDNDAVKTLVAKYIDEEIKEEDIKELKDFLFHWLLIVDNKGSIDIDFEDDNVVERDDEFIESETRTLH